MEDEPKTAGHPSNERRRERAEPHNAIDAAVIAVRGLTQKTQGQIADDIGIDEAALSRRRRNIPQPMRSTARSYVAKLLYANRRTPGILTLWVTIKPQICILFNQLKTDVETLNDNMHSARIKAREQQPAKNALTLFLNVILEKNRSLRRTGLSGLSYYPAITKESALRRIYIAAGRFPLIYKSPIQDGGISHEENLDAFAQNLESQHKTQKPVTEIGALTTHVIRLSYVENGLTQEEFVRHCGVKASGFLSFLRSNSSQQAAVQYGLFLSQHASRSSWFEAVATYFHLAYHRPLLEKRLKITNAETKGIDVSIKSFRRRIQNDWRGAALELLQQAVLLNPELVPPPSVKTLTEIDHASELANVWSSLINGIPATPPDLELGIYRAALEVVRREFEPDATPLLLPTHLHNKPASQLQRAEIAHQASWLLSLRIP